MLALKMEFLRSFCLILLLILMYWECGYSKVANDFYVMSTIPQKNAVNVPNDVKIEITFSELIQETSISGDVFIIRSNHRVSIKATYVVERDKIVLIPLTSFKAGEVVEVQLYKNILSLQEDVLNPFTLKFTCSTSPNTNLFNENNSCTAGKRIDTFYPADIDNDNLIDIVYGIRDKGIIGLYKNKGELNFEDVLVTDNAPNVNYLDVADVDGDDNLDIIASLYPKSFVYYKGDGLGNFGYAIKLNDKIGISEARSVMGVDLDIDGDIDVIGTYNNSVIWYENKGDGFFAERLLFDNNIGGAEQVVVMDIDDDNDRDLIIAAQRDNQLVWCRQEEDGIFTKNIVAGNLNEVSSLYVADSDMDLDLDIAVTSYKDGKVTLHKNTNQDNNSDTYIDFETENIALNVPDASFLNIADINGDTFMDIIVGTQRNSPITIYWGPTFESIHTIDGNTKGIESLWLADLDNSGSLDIIASSASDGQISWYSNDSITNTIITGKNSICINDSQQIYQTSNIPGIEYRWQVKGGIIITSDQNKLEVNWIENQGKVTLIKTSKCSEPDSVALDVLIEDIGNPKISGATITCTQDPILYRVDNNNITSLDYHWEVKGGEIIAGQGDKEIAVVWNALESQYFVTLTAKSRFGNCQKQNNISVDVHAKPNPHISGSQTTCPGYWESYSIGNTNNVVTWEITGGEIDTLDRENIKVLWKDTSVTYIKVIEQDTLASCTASDSIYIRLVSPPKPSIITSETSPCVGDTYLYTATSTALVGALVWSIDPPNAQIIQGQNSNQVSIVWGDTTSTYLKIAHLISGGNCVGLDSILIRPKPRLTEVTILPIANKDTITYCEGEKPIIYVKTNVPADNYTWYRDGKKIAETSDSILVVENPGLYQVDVTQACNQLTSQAVFLSPNKVVVPNAFTPGNRDGLNDNFIIFASNMEKIKELELIIRNKGGNVVFYTNKKEEAFGTGWDGSINGDKFHHVEVLVCTGFVKYEDCGEIPVKEVIRIIRPNK